MPQQAFKPHFRINTGSIPVTGYIRQAKLLEVVPFSSSTLWRKVKAGNFPKPYKLSENITAWKAEEVRNWLDSFHDGAYEFHQRSSRTKNRLT